MTFHFHGICGIAPVGGERIVLIFFIHRNHRFRLIITTDEVVIVIDIP